MESKKNILLSIYNIDMAENKFHNKVKFMNLAHLIGSLNTFSDEHLEAISEKLSVVEEKFTELVKFVDELETPALELIKSYDVTNLTQ